MRVRTRKLVGTVALLVFLGAYSILAMALGASRIVGTSSFAEVLFFLVLGVAWVIPAGLLIRWMQRPD